MKCNDKNHQLIQKEGEKEEGNKQQVGQRETEGKKSYAQPPQYHINYQWHIYAT